MLLKLFEKPFVAQSGDVDDDNDVDLFADDSERASLCSRLAYCTKSLGKFCSGIMIGHVFRIDWRRQDNAAFFDRIFCTELSTEIHNKKKTKANI